MFSSKTVISRGTCFKKLNLSRSFLESFFVGACLCIVNLITAHVLLAKKRYPFHVFVRIVVVMSGAAADFLRELKRVKTCRRVEAKKQFVWFLQE